MQSSKFIILKHGIYSRVQVDFIVSHLAAVSVLFEYHELFLFLQHLSDLFVGLMIHLGFASLITEI